ncbi:MAG: hypothetical protein ABIG44_18195 [Planctomycetota bacterium]
MSLVCRVAIICLGLSSWSHPARGQDAPDPLATLQARETLSDEDTANLRAWITERVATLGGDDAVMAQQAFTELRGALKGTAGFQQSYTTLCIEIIGARYKNMPLVPAARLLTLLNLFDNIRGLDVLLDALGDQRAALRATAVVALRKLQPKIAPNPEAYNRVVAALRDAGKTESAREVLQLIYRALEYSRVQPPPDLKIAATGMLEVLAERAKQFGEKKVRAEGADAVGFKVATTLRTALEGPGQTQYTNILARALHYAVIRYTQGETPLGKVSDKTGGGDEIALRDATELLIRESERQLTELLKPEDAPNVTQKMQAANLTEMVNEMGRWILIFKDKLNLDLPMQNEPPGNG